jgi:hypothetical protein
MPNYQMSPDEPTWFGVGLFVALFVCVLAFFVLDGSFVGQWDTFRQAMTPIVRIVR